MISEPSLLNLTLDEIETMLRAGWRRLRNRKMLAVVFIIPLFFTGLFVIQIVPEYEHAPNMREVVTWALFLWLTVIGFVLWTILAVETVKVSRSNVEAKPYNAQVFASFLATIFIVFGVGPINLLILWFAGSLIFRLL